MSIDPADLRKLAIFADYSDEDLERGVAPYLVELTFEPGTVICQERAPGDSCFFLFEGKVGVETTVASGRAEQIGQLTSGTVFGQLVLLDDGTRSASCVARSKCRIFELSRQDFDTLRLQGQRLAFDLQREIGRALAQQIRQATENLSAMSESRVEDPLALTQRLEGFLRPGTRLGGGEKPAASEVKLRDFELK